MPRYSAAASSGFKAVNTAYFQLRNTSTAQRMYVVEIAVNISAAVTGAPSTIYLSRASANGTSSTTAAGIAHDPGETTAVGTLDSAWSVQPTFSTTAWIRAGGLATTAGGQLIWTFYDSPLIITNSTSAGGLVIACSTAQTAGTLAAYYSWDE